MVVKIFLFPCFLVTNVCLLCINPKIDRNALTLEELVFNSKKDKMLWVTAAVVWLSLILSFISGIVYYRGIHV